MTDQHEFDDGLQLSTENLDALQQIAQITGQSYEEFVNDAMDMGVLLGDVLVSEAPGPVLFGTCEPGDDVLYCCPLDFGPYEEPAALTDELMAMEAQLSADEAKPLEELPIRKELLSRLTDMAMILCVDRASFVQSSIDYYQQYLMAVKRGADVVLYYADESFKIKFQDTESPEDY